MLIDQLHMKYQELNAEKDLCKQEKKVAKRHVREQRAKIRAEQ